MLAYACGADFIVVRFKSGQTYRYSHAKAGWHHVERMKVLAKQGAGLCAYISRNVHDRHDHR